MGIIIPTDFHIFQGGRLNHQPEIYPSYYIIIKYICVTISYCDVAIIWITIILLSIFIIHILPGVGQPVQEEATKMLEKVKETEARRAVIPLSDLEWIRLFWWKRTMKKKHDLIYVYIYVYIRNNDIIIYIII
jgi:hypothetical protein